MKAADIPGDLPEGSVIIDSADESPFNVYVKGSGWGTAGWWTPGEEMPRGLAEDGDYEVIRVPHIEYRGAP
jgi:hypothetical protein